MLARLVVALEIAKFEISDAFNLIVVQRLEFMTPVICITLSSAAEDVISSRKLTFNRLLEAKALLSTVPNIIVVVGSRLIHSDRAHIKRICDCCDFV